jgi:predicted alpha/beta hydrolase
MAATPLQFTAADGFELHGVLHAPAAAPRCGVLIAPAMGVPAGYYADFAAWLAAQGALVLTFDYRGMGASRPARHARSLKGLQADVLTWAERDAAAALEALAARLPSSGTPIHWLGHSLGGQILGLVPNRARVASMVTVGCGSGYWRENARPLRRTVWWLWFVVVPLALPLFGYFPGRALRKVGDLPHGVMAQWRRWCLHREYLMAEGEGVRRQYAGVNAPILSLSFTDDEFMSARNTESIHAFYAGAPRTMKRIAPHEVGAERIGHFGFFRRRFETTLWPQVAAWLAARHPTPEETPA